MLRQRLDVVDGERGIHLLDFVAERRNNGTGIAVRSHNERTNCLVVTELWTKDGRHRSFAETVVFAIAAHTDDLPQWILRSGEVETLANRILIRKEFCRECFVHHGNARLFLVFVLREITAP